MNPKADRPLLLSLLTTLTMIACSDDVSVADTSSSSTSDEPNTETTEDTGDGDGDGDDDSDTGDGDGDPCYIGAEGCTCTTGGACDAGLECDGGVCVPDTAECHTDPDCAALDGPCGRGVCEDELCTLAPGEDGIACDNEEPCMEQGECQAGVCVEVPTDCSMFDMGCIVGHCEVSTDLCDVMLAPDDTPCGGAPGCSSAPVCTMGMCSDPNGQPLFYEDFSDNDAGWILDTNWEIGPAVEGCGDPAMDNSPSDDNGVAGVVLGGCAPIEIHPYYCLTSPVIDTSGLAEVWVTYYRDLWSDFQPYMKSIIQVWDGDNWQMVFQTLGPPEVNDGQWTYFSYEVSAHANAQMQLRWCYNIDAGDVYQRGSWNIDDVTVSASECNGADDL